MRKSETVNEDGWTDWIHPEGNLEGTYQLECCDCGLVHDMQFIVAQNGNPSDKKGFTEFKTIKQKGVIPIFRARRNNRATGATRRWRKKNEDTNT